MWGISCELGITVMTESGSGYSRAASELVFLGENARERAHKFLTEKFGEPVECDPPEDFGRWIWSKREIIMEVERTLSCYWLSPIRVISE